MQTLADISIFNALTDKDSFGTGMPPINSNNITGNRNPKAAIPDIIKSLESYISELCNGIVESYDSFNTLDDVFAKYSDDIRLPAEFSHAITSAISSGRDLCQLESKSIFGITGALEILKTLCSE